MIYKLIYNLEIIYYKRNISLFKKKFFFIIY